MNYFNPLPYSNAMAPYTSPYPNYSAPQMQPYPAAAQRTAPGGINWAQGLEGAKAFFVDPGNSALIMDSEGPHFYIKSVDQSGMPAPLRIFHYSEELQQGQQMTAPAQTAQLGDYITRKEFAALADEVRALRQPTNGGNDNV